MAISIEKTNRFADVQPPKPIAPTSPTAPGKPTSPVGAATPAAIIAGEKPPAEPPAYTGRTNLKVNANPVAGSDEAHSDAPQLENSLVPVLTPPIPPAVGNPTSVLTNAAKENASSRERENSAGAATRAARGDTPPAAQGATADKAIGGLNSLRAGTEPARSSAPTAPPGVEVKGSQAVKRDAADSAANSVQSARARNALASYGNARGVTGDRTAAPASGSAESTAALANPGADTKETSATRLQSSGASEPNSSI